MPAAPAEHCIRFGTLPDGRPVRLWRIGPADGVNATVMAYGGGIRSLTVPTRRGAVDVIVGHATWDGYLAPNSLRSAITGRFANRIANGAFTLDGARHRLDRNAAPHTIHGGSHGFDRTLWEGEMDGPDLVLRHTSPDGDQGFPGTLAVEVRYAVSGDALAIAYSAVTDRPTIVNLTNHAYFNLSGGDDVLDHVVTVDADRFVETDADGIPTGRLLPVAGTDLDLRRPRPLREGLAGRDPHIGARGGYDHAYVLGAAMAAEARPVARVTAGGLAMEVATTEPSLQLYTGNNIRPPLRRHAALCLETQHFPDAPNHPGFPSTVLRPGETFRSRTTYGFGAA